MINVRTFINAYAKDVLSLRKSDVYNMFSACPKEDRKKLADYVLNHRKDLAKEVEDVLSELKTESKLRSAINQIIEEELSLDEDNSFGQGHYPLPASLSRLGRFVANLQPTKLVNHRVWPQNGIHMLTAQVDTQLSIMAEDMKSLLSLGLVRIQCNEPGTLGFYFKQKTPDSPKNESKKGTSLKTEGYWEDLKSDNDSNKAVIEAFLVKEKANGNKLSTDGTKLTGLWAMGEPVAQWIETPDGEERIQFFAQASMAAQEIQRIITKTISKDWLLNRTGFSKLTEAITSSKSSKDVLGAFLTREKADGKKLSTDGTRLHINGLGGNNVAEWVDDGNGEKIKFNDLGSKTAQQVQNAIAKIAPSNWLLNGKGY